MNRYEQAQENQLTYRLPVQGKTEGGEAFIGRIEKAVTERLIHDVMDSPIARARLGGLVEKR